METLLQSFREILESAAKAVGEAARHEPEASLYSREPPVLRAISPLAEGADRQFAEIALGLNYELCVPMPFAQAEFEEDFAPDVALEPDSLGRFHELLERARAQSGLTIFELDGERSDREAAYGAAGRVVVNQSDLLVVVWDGHSANGGGGTFDSLKEALHFNVPVLLIDALEPSRWRVLREGGDLEALAEDIASAGPLAGAASASDATIAESVDAIVRDELSLPAAAAPQHSERQAPATRSIAQEYFAERRPVLNLAFVWKMFRDLLGEGKLDFPPLVTPDYVSQMSASWPILGEPALGRIAHNEARSKLEDWVNRQLRTHYAWSDKLADLYADSYRSAYVVAYLMSALAVFAALLPVGANLGPTGSWIANAAEFLALVVVLALLAWGRARHWHDRWMEYRLLAELIRQFRFMVPLGGGRPFSRMPAHLGVYGDPRQTWMYWHVRAIARATGIPTAHVTPDYVRDCLIFIAGVVGTRDSGQWGFHRLSELRSANINDRLHESALLLFVLTAIGTGLHPVLGLVLGDQALVATLGRWLTLCSATLPALGAALAAINNQGEFTRISKRSAAMASGFEAFAERIAGLQKTCAERGLKLADIVPLAARIAEAMVEEHFDWRVVFLDRPQTAT